MLIDMISEGSVCSKNREMKGFDSPHLRCLQKPLIGIQSWDVDWFRVLLQLSLMIAPYGYLMNCQNDFRNMDYFI